MLRSVISIISGVLVISYKVCATTVVGLVGETVTLPCKYDIKIHGVSSMCWGRNKSLFTCEYTLVATEGLMVNFRESQRYHLPSMLQEGDVSLIIKKARKSDTGFYVCRIEIPGPFNDISSSVYLIITSGLDPFKVIAPTNVARTNAAEEEQRRDGTDDPNIAAVVVPMVHAEDGMETYVLTSLRIGAVVYIPGLILALLWKLRRNRKGSSRSENEDVVTQPAASLSHRPQETPHGELYEM